MKSRGFQKFQFPESPKTIQKSPQKIPKHLKNSPQNLTKYEVKGISKLSISLLFSELRKIQNYKELGKMCFLLEKKKNFKTIENFAHPIEFFILRKFHLLMFYPSRELVKWKHFKYKFSFSNDFMMDKELNLCKM